ncbi:MAG: glycosyltransferase family 2 protein [Parcubacteria group bacterium]|nr:glycosyltransferase family 2 protein [Parcubacteria group bacterium]
MKDHLRVGRAPELQGKDRLWWRFFEVLPGALTWMTFVAMAVASRYLPAGAAVFILAFDLYWFLKTVYLSVHLRSSYREMRKNMSKDWIALLDQLPPQSYKLATKSWHDVWHLIIFPVYLESYEVLRSSFKALAASHYPLERLLVVVSCEERGGEALKESVGRISREFSNAFGALLVTTHPTGMEGEIAGKGANEAWAGRKAVEHVIAPRNIPYERVVVSIFDADTAVFPEFFGCLTYHYLTSEKPLRASFQPVPLFVNNVWVAPAFARVMGFSSTFWQLMQQARPERLITFSSHSMGLQPLVEVGLWQPNVVSEDSRIFYQCLLFYSGDWRVVPLHYPVAMDANFAGTFWGTIRNQYKQQRRWGYGAENIPYLLFGFLKNKKVPRSLRWYHSFTIIEGFHSWATNSVLIFVLGWLPRLIGGEGFRATLLSYSLPQLTGWIMGFAMVGMVTSAVISIMLLPPKPPQLGKQKFLLMFFQWILMPFNMIFLSTVPAIEAQTRLMFGKYMGFWTTPKVRRPGT